MAGVQRDVYLVIGGSGFLGRHIVEQLRDRGDIVSVFDIVQRHHDVPFYSGDISEESQVADALQKSGATCIIHTASPPHGHDPALYFRVNVDGTRAVVAAAQLPSNSVNKLVFTSSAGVVFNGTDLIGVDERLPPAEKAMDAYNESKYRAEELVLKANGVGGVWTVALRPAGIFGPGDRQVMAGLYQVYERKQTHFQIGDNTNLFDWTYVGNVAKAHLLAADKLVPLPTPPPTDPEKDPLEPPTISEEVIESVSIALPSITLTTGTHRVPTSAARPLGPALETPPNAEQLTTAFNSPSTEVRRVVRNRYDQFSEQALARANASQLHVAGQAFFITNGEPIYFWDLMRLVWGALDARGDSHAVIPPRKRIVLGRTIGLALAEAAEWWGWLVGKEPAFTKFRVTYACSVRWHNIEKARRVLGYEPDVGMEEGVKRMVDWFMTEHKSSNS